MLHDTAVGRGPVSGVEPPEELPPDITHRGLPLLLPVHVGVVIVVAVIVIIVIVVVIVIIIVVIVVDVGGAGKATAY
jgi:hypothetical protein